MKRFHVNVSVEDILKASGSTRHCSPWSRRYRRPTTPSGCLMTRALTYMLDFTEGGRRR
jgi:hypothetical protein